MHQKTKIVATGFVLIFGVVLLSGAGCAKTKPSIFTGQLTTESKCIELMAQALTGYQYGQNQNMAAIIASQQKIDDLKKQYGWGDEDIQNHCKDYANQKDFMDRVGKRMKEITSETK